MGALSVLNKYFVKYKWHLILGIIFVLASNYFKILIPKAVRESIDLVVERLSMHQLNTGTIAGEAIEASISSSLLYYGLFVLAASLLTGLFMYWMRQTIIVMSRLIEYDMRDEIFKHYTTLDQSFFRRNSTGDLMSRISEDVSKVRMYVGPAVLYAINMGSLFVFVLYAMFSVSPTLSFYTLIPLPILSVSIYYVSNLINKKSYIIQKQLAKLNSVAQEVYSGIRVVKSYVQEDALTGYFEEESEQFKSDALKLAQINAVFFPLMLFLVGISTLITIYVGGILVMKGQISPGNLAEFVIYVNMLTWPVMAIGWIASIIQQAKASQTRINEFLSYPSQVISDIGQKIAFEGNMEFKNVSFTYEDSGIEALKNLSFKLEAGKSLAIVGRTATGKTTISDLILRLFDPTTGDIFVDNKNLKSVHLRDLRGQLAYVPQDVFLFSDTIEQNIRFGNQKGDAEVETYAKMAAVHDDISNFKEGYQTMIGERGVSLSGGQKQRISIARALIKESKMLILDDCLSAVDVETEEAIIDTLIEQMSKRTTIFITHRLNALPHFDNILVLDQGRMIEYGKHADLVNAGGFYAELFLQQNAQQNAQEKEN